MKRRKNYGTGSKPPLLHGLHLIILFIPKKLPFNAPYLSIACFVYSEQVGVYLQWTLSTFAKNGDRVFWYILIKNMNIFFI